MLKIEIDDEELLALIDFHRSMREDALDRDELEDAQRRKERLSELEAIAGNTEGSAS